MNFSATILTLLCAAHPSTAPTDLAQDVAAWRADELTRDDGPKALESLRALVALAEAELSQLPENDELRSLVAGLYRTELDGLAKRGRKRQMVARLVELLELAHGPRDSKSAQALAAAATEAIDAKRIRTVLAPLSSSIPNSQASGISASRASDEILAAAVEEALLTGETEILGQIGPAAVPSLAKIARGRDGSEKGTMEQSALAFLSAIQPATALDVALDLVSQGDVLLKSRVIAAFETSSPFESPEVWSATDQPGQFVLRKPAWAQIIPMLLEAPGVPVGLTHPMVREFIQRDFGPEGYESLIEGTLAARRWGDAKLKTHEYVLPQVARDAAVRIVSSWSPDQVVTKRLLDAVEALERGGDASLAHSLAANKDPSLRRSLVDAFGPRRYSRAVEAGKTEDIKFQPVINDAYLQAIDQFVRGSSDSHARGAISRAKDLARETGRGVIPGSLLAAWIEADVQFEQVSTGYLWFRELVDHFRWLTPAERRDLMPRAAVWIAGQPTDNRHRTKLLGLFFESTIDIPTLIDAANALKGAGLPSEAASGLAATAKRRLAEDPVGAADIVEWLNSNVTLAHWQEFVEKARETTGLVVHAPFLKGLLRADQMAIARSLLRVGYDKLDWIDQDELPFSRLEWLELLGDKTLTVDGARWILGEIVQTKGDPLPVGAEQIFARAIAMIGESPRSSSDYADIGVDPEDVLLELLSMSELPDEVLLNFYVPLQRDDVMRRVRAKFPRDTWRAHPNSPLISSLLTAIARGRNPSDMEDLIEGLHAGTMVHKSLSGLLQYESSRIYLPLAEALLSPSVRAGAAYRRRALGYVASFLDDEAIEILLTAARGTRDAEFRAEVFAEVEQILVWQEAESKWRTGQGTAQKRNLAIAELTHILEDPASSLEARVESLGGLALLGAVEEIPRLIRSMEEGPAALRAAAKDALEQLRSAAKK